VKAVDFKEIFSTGRAATQPHWLKSMAGQPNLDLALGRTWTGPSGGRAGGNRPATRGAGCEGFIFENTIHNLIHFVNYFW